MSRRDGGESRGGARVVCGDGTPWVPAKDVFDGLGGGGDKLVPVCGRDGEASTGFRWTVIRRVFGVGAEVNHIVVAGR